jgi:hypothetical protein
MGGLSLGTAMVMTAVALYSNTHPQRIPTHDASQKPSGCRQSMLGCWYFSVLVGNIGAFKRARWCKIYSSWNISRVQI